MLNALHLKIPHIKRSIYSIEATSKSCLQLFIAVFLFCWKKKAKMMEPYEETCYLWTRSGIRFRFTWERYSLGPKITRVESATDTKSDCSEFVFRPVPCKRIKRNVYMESDTNSHQSKFVPVSCIYPTLFSGTWPFASGWHMKGAVSRQSSSFCLILPITCPQSLWNLK